MSLFLFKLLILFLGEDEGGCRHGCLYFGLCYVFFFLSEKVISPKVSIAFL